MKKSVTLIELDKVKFNKDRVSKIRDREAKKKVSQAESKKKGKVLDKHRVTSPARKAPNSSGKPVVSSTLTHKR